MGERMISPEDAGALATAINRFVNDLEREGFERGHIGAAMAGIGLALAQVNSGHHTAMKIINNIRDICVAEASQQTPGA